MRENPAGVTVQIAHGTAAPAGLLDSVCSLKCQEWGESFKPASAYVFQSAAF